MKRSILITAALGATLLAIPAQAQIARDARDKMVAKDATGPAEGYKDQPWWAPLSECTAVFVGKSESKAQEFAALAVKRLVLDRGLTAEAARALLSPYIQGSAKSRADMMVMGYGQVAVEQNCESLRAQYEAL